MRAAALLVLLPLAARAETCPPLKLPAAKLESATKHDVAVPDLVDFGDHSLDPFFDKLARVARGAPNTVLRIGTYGDSNWTNDKTAGEIRRRLQAAFGDAGHGWVSFGLPWGWYHHQNVRHGLTGRWSTWNPSALEIGDRLYGFAGASAESSQAGATVWVETAKAGDPVGTAVASFDLAYLARPKGGAFEVLIDDDSKEVVETDSATAELKFLHYKVTDGAHRLVVKVKRGKVRVFGVSLERESTGIVLDGIGMNALNPPLMARMDSEQIRAGLARRSYDLLIESTGTKVWQPERQPNAWPAELALFRSALPNTPLMLWSAPDFVQANSRPAVSLAYMRTFAKAKRDMAKTARIAFWDQYEALGGYGSAPKFFKEGWLDSDGVHLEPRFNTYIGERFVYALLAEFARRVEQNPKLGCKAN
jgi:hypothetical protein